MGRQAIIALAVCIVSAAGCGRNEVTYSAGDAKIKVSQQGGSATVVETNDRGTTTVTVNQGGSLPRDFPKDVPVFQGASVRMSSVREDQMHVVFHAPAPVGEVLAFYQNGLKAQGWTIEATINMDNAASIQAGKGQRKCSAAMGRDGDATTLTLTLLKEET